MRTWNAPLLVLALLLLGGEWISAAETKESLKKRFEARHAKLLGYKTAGKVGETAGGYVMVVKAEYASDTAMNAVLEAENADRKALYAILAKEQGQTVAYIGRQNAIFKFKKAGPDEYFRGRDGVWRQKKEMLKKAQ